MRKTTLKLLKRIINSKDDFELFKMDPNSFKHLHGNQYSPEDFNQVLFALKDPTDSNVFSDERCLKELASGSHVCDYTEVTYYS